MSDDIIKEIDELHQRIHRDDPLPVTEQERQAQEVLSALRASVMKLYLARASPNTIDLSLFYFWLRIATFNRFITDEAFRLLTSDFGSASATVIHRLKALADELRDDGPTAPMRDLGERLQELRKLIQGWSPAADAAEARRQAELVNGEIWTVTCDFLRRDIHPTLIESGSLYHWVRTSTLRSSAPEEMFQKLERNWPAVMKDIGALVDQFVHDATAAEAALHDQKH